MLVVGVYIENITLERNLAIDNKVEGVDTLRPENLLWYICVG